MHHETHFTIVEVLCHGKAIVQYGFDGPNDTPEWATQKARVKALKQLSSITGYHTLDAYDAVVLFHKVFPLPTEGQTPPNKESRAGSA